jgi:hypothetical protein
MISGISLHTGLEFYPIGDSPYKSIICLAISFVSFFIGDWSVDTVEDNAYWEGYSDAKEEQKNRVKVL